MICLRVPVWRLLLYTRLQPHVSPLCPHSFSFSRVDCSHNCDPDGACVLKPALGLHGAQDKSSRPEGATGNIEFV